MSWQPLNDVMGEIKTRQNDLDGYVDLNYRYGVYEPGTTFLRYLITNFKLQLYSSLREKYENLDNFLPYYNIYFLVRGSKSPHVLMYPTKDQVLVANHRLGGNTTWFFEKDFGTYGLAARVFNAATSDKKKKFNYNVHPDWYRELEKIPEYKRLDEELKIYGVDKKKPSYLYIHALKQVEILLVLIDERPPDFSKFYSELIEGTYGTFIEILNKTYNEMICDLSCWYDIWVKDKAKINKQAFEPIYNSVKQMDININDKNSATGGIGNGGENLKNKFESLVKELKKIDTYCSSKPFKPMYSRPYIRDNLKFYDYPISVQGNEDYLMNFGNRCIELRGDSANDLEEVSTNLIHAMNMEKIALSWGEMIGGPNLNKYIPNLLKAIWLHYIGLTKYASTNKNLEFGETVTYRTTYSYLEEDRLKELKNQLDLTDDDIRILKILVHYHSRIAPLTGKSKEIECDGKTKTFDSLEGVIDNLPAYPYFLTITILRLIDSIDVQWNRCGQYRINHLKKRLEETQTPTKEIIHFFKHAYFDVGLGGSCRVLYGADFHSPMFLILYAFAKVISGIEQELKKVNQEGIVEKIRQDWTTLTGNSTKGDLEIGFLKLRERKFDVDVSLQGMLTDFSKEGWWGDQNWSMFNYEKSTEQIPKLEEGEKKEDGEQKGQEYIPIPKTQIVHISETQKKIVRIAVAQFYFELTKSFPFVLKNKDEVKTKVFLALDIAKHDGADIVCLPELCLCEEWISEIKEKYANMIIIGGSFSKNNENLCPVIIESDLDIPYQSKITPSDPEIPKMIPGDRVYIYETQFGRFMVLICRDFDNLAHYYRDIDVDMIFCPSSNSAYERFQNEAHVHVEKVPLYILIANNEKYGGTSIFGQWDKDRLSSWVDNGCKDAEEVEHKKLIYKLCEVKKGQEEIIIADFNLVHKSVQKPIPANPKKEIKSVDNLKKISIGCCSGSIGDMSKKPTESVVGDGIDDVPVDEFDVFIAYNSKDVEQVTALSKLLEGRGLNPWLNTEQVPPGRWFQDIIQQVIPKVKSATVTIGKEGIGKWQKLELRSFISQCVENDIPVIPVLSPGVNEFPSELLFLKELNWVRFIDKIDEQEALDNLEWGITGEHPQRKQKWKL